ncbi:hypothetical protein P4H71_26025 [Paenibacillus kribbensis]|uniref:hypothetical protein n=1 Tax=Paenibacillus kribbensis TaxID=172713 RepID=UPI002DB79B9A|nr:hypothetical protein [Paenibacillus kribbensis]MEC0237779.1 hypothetical protein [Paenibacillus kribbensis]
MWEPIRFLLFSTAEAMAAFFLMTAIFRLKGIDYTWQALYISLVMNLQSYMIREETNLSFLAPIVNILLFTFLLATVIKVPILWSAIISTAGVFMYGAIQAVFMITMGIDSTNLQNSTQGALLQAVTSAFVFFTAWFLFKFRIGFTFDFEKLRLKWEHTIVSVLIIMSLAAAAFVLYAADLALIVIYFVLAAGMFLYYALKKEREEG